MYFANARATHPHERVNQKEVRAAVPDEARPARRPRHGVRLCRAARRSPLRTRTHAYAHTNTHTHTRTLRTRSAHSTLPCRKTVHRHSAAAISMQLTCARATAGCPAPPAPPSPPHTFAPEHACLAHADGLRERDGSQRRGDAPLKLEDHHLPVTCPPPPPAGQHVQASHRRQRRRGEEARGGGGEGTWLSQTSLSHAHAQRPYGPVAIAERTESTVTSVHSHTPHSLPPTARSHAPASFTTTFTGHPICPAAAGSTYARTAENAHDATSGQSTQRAAAPGGLFSCAHTKR